MKKNTPFAYILFSYFFFLVTNYSFAQCYTSVKAGEIHTVAKKADGSLWAWGQGGWNQLNNTTYNDEWSPIAFTTTTDWQFITAGYYNTFAIKTSGELWGSGSNYYGQLGIGTMNPISPLVQISPGSFWKQVAAGYDHTAGIKADGTLWTWGDNGYHQLGDNSSVAQSTLPVQISTATNWKTTAAGVYSTTFALKNDGTIWGWGSNAGLILDGGGVSY